MASRLEEKSVVWPSTISPPAGSRVAAALVVFCASASDGIAQLDSNTSIVLRSMESLGIKDEKPSPG